MKSLTTGSGEIKHFLVARQREGIKNVCRLGDFLKNLRYEGKPSIGKNIMRGKRMTEMLERELENHIKAEEKILYPYVERHIPRMGALIQILKSEHETFRKTFLEFKSELKRFLKGKNYPDRKEKLIKINEIGTYLVYLLKHHLEIEMRSLYRLIDRELSAWEKKELSTAIKRSFAHAIS